MRLRLGLLPVIVSAVLWAGDGAAAAGPLTFAGSLVPSGTGEGLTAAAISGGYEFAGAPNASLDALAQGAVFVFAGTQRVATLVQAVPTADAGLGGSVTASGDTVAVTAVDGSIDVFTMPAGGWSGIVRPSAVLSAPAALQGPVVSGSEIVAGGPSAGSGAGAVYVFSEPAGGWAGDLDPAATLTAPDAGAYAELGTSVAVSGSTIVAGAPQALTGSQADGAVYVFEQPAAGWTGTLAPTAKLVPGNLTGRRLGVAPDFGQEIAISGQTIAAAAPTVPALDGFVDVFTEPAAGWQDAAQTAVLAPSGGQLGGFSAPPSGLAIAGDEVAANGTVSSSHAPVVYVFGKPAGGWSGTVSQSAVLVSSAGDQLGVPTFEGDELIAGQVGAVSESSLVATGPVDVFDEPAGGWSGDIAESARLTEQPGLATGEEALFQQPLAGWVSTTPNAVLAPPGEAPQVGFDSTSVSGDVAVAAGDGDADVFIRGGDGTWGPEPAASLVDPGGAGLSAPAISGPTIVALAGAGIDVFTEPAGGWSGTVTPSATLSVADGASLDAVAIAGPEVAALGIPSQGGDSGFVFTEPAAGWSGVQHESAILQPPRRSYVYPQTIGIDGGTVALGGAISGATVVTQNSAFLFTEPPGGWAGTLSTSATLTPPYYDNGTEAFVYVEPASGWSGTMRPAARLAAGYGRLAISGSTIAQSAFDPPGKYESCPCTATVHLFTRPPGGWSGILASAALLTSLTDANGDVPLAIDGDTLLTSPAASARSYDPETPLEAFSITGPISEAPLNPGPPFVKRMTLTGLRHRRPNLRLEVRTGSYEAPLVSLQLTLPRGLSAARSERRLLAGVGPSGWARRVVRLSARTLRIVLANSFSVVPVQITVPALIESPAFRRSFIRHPDRSLRFGLVLIDMSGHVTRLHASVPFTPRPARARTPARAPAPSRG